MARTLRRTHIMHILGNFGPGGAEMGVARLIKALSHPPYRHSVCSIRPDLRMQIHLPPEVTCHTLGIDGSSRLAFKGLAALFKTVQVDIAHVNNIAPWFDTALASKVAGCRCIQTFHGVEEHSLRFSLPKKIQLRCALTLSDRLTSVSRASAHLFSHLTHIDEKRVSVIDNGIDTDTFAPVISEEKKQVRKTLGLPQESMILGCVAALRDVKNHKGLLTAFSKVVQIFESAMLVLVGDGPLADGLRQQALALNISKQILFAGQQDNIDQYLKAVDLFVLNSRTEGLSYAILEAMSSGLPIVATDVGGNVQIIDHEVNGMLYEEGSERALSDTLIEILRDPERIRRMGERAREKILDRYSLDTMIQQYDALYRGLI